MVNETRQVTEQPPRREPLQPYQPRVGLQTRLLMGGDALNPDKTDLPVVAKDHLGAFETRDYGIFQDASTAERKAYWQGKENNEFARQKAAWIQSTVTTFTNEQTQQFFQSEKGRQWSETFVKLGINTQEFNQQAAEQLYAAYFTGGKSDIKKFVKDVIDKNAHQDLAAIQWLANIFGKNSSEIVAQLIDAETRLQTQPDALVEEANKEETVENQQVRRANNLQPREKELLAFLTPHITTPTIEKPDIKPGEQIVPSIDVEANREGAEQMIRILRDSSKYTTPSTNPIGSFTHDLGHVRLTPPFETSWFYSIDITNLAESKYKLPMAVYAPGNHAMLLLQGPHKTADGSWKIRTFDPFNFDNQGEIERELPNFDPQKWESALPPEKYAMLNANGIIANDLAREEIYQNNYDISIANNPTLAPYRQMFVAGKLTRYQYDASNCVPYTLFANVLLHALKPGDTEFKTQGLPQFAEDFGMHIRTLEEILGGEEHDEALPIQIAIPDIENGIRLPQKYGNHSPAIELSDLPANTQSIAIVMEDQNETDPQNPEQPYTHWIVYNIDPQTREIPENTVPQGALQALNSWGHPLYDGPDSGIEDEEHHYRIVVYALDRNLDIPQDGESLTRQQFEEQLKQRRILSQGERTVVYGGTSNLHEDAGT